MLGSCRLDKGTNLNLSLRSAALLSMMWAPNAKQSHLSAKDAQWLLNIASCAPRTNGRC